MALCKIYLTTHLKSFDVSCYKNFQIYLPPVLVYHSAQWEIMLLVSQFILAASVQDCFIGVSKWISIVEGQEFAIV